jgi:hypothetical protein
MMCAKFLGALNKEMQMSEKVHNIQPLIVNEDGLAEGDLRLADGGVEAWDGEKWVPQQEGCNCGHDCCG